MFYRDGAGIEIESASWGLGRVISMAGIRGPSFAVAESREWEILLQIGGRDSTGPLHSHFTSAPTKRRFEATDRSHEF
jgi:hypothetical protein